MKFSLPDIPLWLHSAVMFTMGVIIGYVTLFVPERSPGPVGFVWTAICISVGLSWLWKVCRRGLPISR